MIPGQAVFLGNMYAFGAMLSFTIAHISVIRLRKKYPDFKRPWTGPGNIPFRGYSLPLFAVFGGIGTGLAFVVVTALHVDVALAGIGWLALGCVIYPIYRHRQGLDLTSTVKVAIPAPGRRPRGRVRVDPRRAWTASRTPRARWRRRSRSRRAGGAASTCS